MPEHVRDAGVWTPAKDLWVRDAGVWMPVRKAFIRNAGVWRQTFQDEVVATLPAFGTGAVAADHFPAADWANPLLTKRLVIPANVEIGTNQSSYALAISRTANGQAGSFAGDLIIDNYGIISGIGGAPNSGVGGTAVWGNLPGRDGRKAILNNYDTLRGGGGGGGRGGNGGRGIWYDYQDTGQTYQHFSGYQWHWEDRPANAHVKLWVGGSMAYESWNNAANFNATSHQNGGYVYEKGSWIQDTGGGWRIFYMRRYLITPIANITAGGAGGDGGRGQGYDNPNNQPGASGAGGGLNAGAGGTGGYGMHYGGAGYTDGKGQGLPGYAGAAGNYDTAGNAGAAGGLGGFYLNGLANIQLNNFGTVQGRVQ